MALREVLRSRWALRESWERIGGDGEGCYGMKRRGLCTLQKGVGSAYWNRGVGSGSFGFDTTCLKEDGYRLDTCTMMGWSELSLDIFVTCRRGLRLRQG